MGISSNSKKRLSIALADDKAGQELSDLFDSLLNKDAEFVYVRKFGNNSTADGTLARPFATVGAAQASIKDATITDLGGIRKNPNKPSYIIDIGPGTFIESNTWAPLWFLNYRGAGRDLTFVRRSNNSAITMNYGSNYAFSQSMMLMTINNFSIIRTPGFTDTSFAIALGGNGFVNSAFNFFEFASSNCTFRGSGYDNAFNAATGKQDVMADSVTFRNCTLTGTNTFSAILLNANNSPLAIAILNFVGSDGSVATSGGYVNSLSAGSTTTRLDVSDYAGITLRHSPSNQIRLLNRLNNPTITAIYGKKPSVSIDTTSAPNSVTFLGGALGDQVDYITSPANLARSPSTATATGGTPYINTTGAQRILSLGGAGVDITLQNRGNFGALNVHEQIIIDYAGDSGTNPITIRTPRFWKFSASLGGGTSITRSSNGGHWICTPTTIGSSAAVAQVEEITTVADVSGSLNNTYFSIYTLAATAEQILYVPWFNVNGAGTAPTGLPAGANLLQVNLATDATAAQVASALLAVLQVNSNTLGFDQFSNITLPSPDKVRCTNAVGGVATQVADGAIPTGFTFATTTPGVDNILGTYIVTP